MKKQLLVKYISGEANEQEQKLVQEWIKSNECNLRYFVELKTLWIKLNMPQEKASEEDMRKLNSITSTKKNRIAAKGSCPLRVRRYWAAAACIALLLGANLYFLLSQKSAPAESSPAPLEKRVTLNTLSAEQKHTLYTNKGVKGCVDLPDGSKVWLNSDSKITYPNKFEGATREVEMSGECYFEVTPNPDRPMVVSTNKNFQVKVLGTKFNLRTYENEQEAKATLVKGSIEILKNSNNKEVLAATLLPSQSYIASERKAAEVAEVDTIKQLAWTRGVLIFDQTPIEEVIKELERWHGTEFIVQDKSLLNSRFTAEFNSESLVQILEMLKYCSLINYQIKGNKVWLFSK